MKRASMGNLVMAILVFASCLACKGAPEPKPSAPVGETEAAPAGDGAPVSAIGAMPACPQVEITSPDPARRWPSFYKKSSPGAPLPVLSSDSVPDEAHRVVHYVLHQMLDERPCVAAARRRANVRVAILAENEQTTDIPELADLNQVFPQVDWNVRARALGPTLPRPVLLINVENLLQTETDLHRTEHILIHELSHAIYELGLDGLDGADELHGKLERAYNLAMEEGRWADTYAAVDLREYWAEGVQSYFDANAEAIPANGIHNEVNTRAELLEHDPLLHDLIQDVFGPRKWSKRCALEQGSPWSPIAMAQKQCAFRHIIAPAIPCEEVSSGAGGEPASVMVINQSTTDALEVFWVAPDGSEKSYGILPPRSELALQSFVGHGWRARTSGGACVDATRTPGLESRWFLL